MRKLDLAAASALLSSLSTAALATETVTYTYDAIGRVVQVTHNGSVNNGMQTTYAHDHADNRTHVTITGASTSSP